MWTRVFSSNHGTGLIIRRPVPRRRRPLHHHVARLSKALHQVRSRDPGREPASPAARMVATRRMAPAGRVRRRLWFRFLKVRACEGGLAPGDVFPGVPGAPGVPNRRRGSAGSLLGLDAMIIHKEPQRSAKSPGAARVATRGGPDLHITVMAPPRVTQTRDGDIFIWQRGDISIGGLQRLTSDLDYAKWPTASTLIRSPSEFSCRSAYVLAFAKKMRLDDAAAAGQCLLPPLGGLLLSGCRKFSASVGCAVGYHPTTVPNPGPVFRWGISYEPMSSSIRGIEWAA